MSIADLAVMCFPNNAQLIVAAALRDIDPETAPGANDGLRVVLRPVQDSDLTETVGVYADNCDPDEETREMQGRIPVPATVQKYSVIVESLVVDTDVERGIALHSTLAFLLRSRLYGDIALHEALPELQVTRDGYRERFKRFWVPGQRYGTRQNKSAWYFMSVTTLFFETEVQAV